MTSLQQAQKLIKDSQSVLIALTQQIRGDSLGSALALFFTLKKLGKNANLLLQKIPEKFRFLTDWQPPSLKDFIISIDGSGKEISEMRYEKNANGLKIYLTLNKGEISEKDISFSALRPDHDLLIVFGADSLFISSQVPTPILNMADLTENNFSLAETTTKLIQLMDSENNLMDNNIATCLLAGVVSYSQNFRNSKTKPETFTISAYLIEKGADHQKIIQYFYKQKGIPQIKILGRILEKLSFDEKKELYCASLAEKDFQDCQAHPKDLGYVIEELKFNFNYLRDLLILWESRASPVLIRGIIYSAKPELIKKVLEDYEGVSRGEGALFLVKDCDLNSAKEKILRIL